MVIQSEDDTLIANAPVPIDEDINRFDGGILWLQNSDGARARSYRVYNGVQDPGAAGNLRGKNNGLGDLEAFCIPN